MSRTFLSLFIHLNVILVNVRTKSAAQLGNVIILITVRIEAVLEKIGQQRQNGFRSVIIIGVMQTILL